MIAAPGVPPGLVEIIVCPKSGRPMILFPRGEHDRGEAEAFFLCPASRLRYRVVDGVPDLVVADAAPVSATELARLLARAQALGLAVPPAVSHGLSGP